MRQLSSANWMNTSMGSFNPKYFCCYCGQQGHLAYTCKKPRDIPIQKPYEEPKKDDVPDIENWYDMYGGV